jgi:hypothetical protein
LETVNNHSNLNPPRQQIWTKRCHRFLTRDKIKKIQLTCKYFELDHVGIFWVI